jgi:hypothetical protein
VLRLKQPSIDLHTLSVVDDDFDDVSRLGTGRHLMDADDGAFHSSRYRASIIDKGHSRTDDRMLGEGQFSHGWPTTT